MMIYCTITILILQELHFTRRYIVSQKDTLDCFTAFLDSLFNRFFENTIFRRTGFRLDFQLNPPYYMIYYMIHLSYLRIMATESKDNFYAE